MEKIHTAILKARMEREAKLAHEVPVSAAPVAEPIAAPAITETVDHWAMLDQFKPEPRVLARNRLVAFESGSDSICYDVLRTNILRQMRAKGWKRLAITSPTPACGKTTTCLNLGFSLSRLRDLRSMVVEIDLRRPSMRSALKLKQRHMFASVLAGEGKAADNLVAYGKTLAFGTNHAPVKNSAELLAGAQVAAALTEMDRLFAPDITIFDMTPMLVSDDTISFLANVDCVLMVAGAGMTTTAQVDKCERELAAQTNVLGVVLNKCQFMAPDEDYGYDY
jgi:protein-tyrosine kinase